MPRCPHGADASRCSQCVGAKPRRIDRGPDGKMRIDGKPIERKFQPHSFGYQPGRRGRPSAEEKRRRDAAIADDDDLE